MAQHNERNRRGVTAALALLIASVSCIEWQQPLASEEPTIANYISSVETLAGDARAALRAGTAPAEG
ncbi:MAG: hypothetical protein FJ202_03165 [Gemmatimonadetes bacterium]|nr:hypothetical protein [Gemmatimonadota bacterium]